MDIDRKQQYVKYNYLHTEFHADTFQASLLFVDSPYRSSFNLSWCRSGPKAEVETATEAEAEPEAAADRSGSESGGSDSESGAACVALYAAGRYSPPPLAPRALEPGALLLDAAQDAARLHYLRARTHAARAPAPPAPAAAAAGAAAFEREARRGMGADEAAFGVEAPLPALPDADAAPWPDKFRPRKPRYFNRVHTGFEWNKYNQTHYDMDNPPPKIVQGYKFNIFYPDLMDPRAAPEFSLAPCPDPEFAVLRFRAGPPYEDIAFKIVNREWEYSYKRGFRCHFHNNIFQLWFHFKRYRYRR